MASFGSLPLTCQVCNKTFSGRVPAQQHYSSAEHKKRAANAKTQVHSRFSCRVCNKSCDTLKILEAHNQSPRHHAEMEKQRRLQAPGHVISPQNPGHGTNNDAPKEYVFDGIRGFCYICNLELTSRSHAQDHLKGQKHDKKKKQKEMIPSSSFFANHEPAVQTDRRGIGVENGLNANNARSKPGSSSTQFCELCQVPFSGPDNAEQHYSSNNHNKKVTMARLAEKGELLPLKCDVCDCPFTGQENAREHFDSTKHKRNIANQKLKVCETSSPNTTDDQKIAVDPDPRRMMANWGLGGSSSQERSTPEYTEQTTTNIDSVTTRMSNVNLFSQTGPDSCQYLTKRREVEETDASIIKAFPAEEVSHNIEDSQPASNMGFLKADPISASDNNTKCFSTQIDHAARNTYERSISENDEKKIQAETHSSVGDGSSLSSMLSSEISTATPNSFSQSDEPVRFIRNNLRSPSNLNPDQPVSIGRGRAFLELKNNNTVIGRLLEKNRQSDASQSHILGQGQIVGQEDEEDQAEIIKPVNQFQHYKPSETKPSSKDGGGDGVNSTASHGSRASYTVPLAENTNSLLLNRGDFRPSSQTAGGLFQVSESSICQHEPSDAMGGFKADTFVAAGPGVSTRPYIPMNVGLNASPFSPGSTAGNTQLGVSIPHPISSTSDAPRPFSQSSRPISQTGLYNQGVGRADLEIPSSFGRSDQEIPGGGPLGISKSALPTQVNYSESQMPRPHQESSKIEEFTFDRRACRGQCHVCNIELTSTNHMTQHVTGKKHTSAAAVWRAARSGSAAVASPLVCTVCCVQFSGFEARQQHMESRGHLQKEQQAQGDTQSYHCDICNIACSGEASLQQHLQGAAHIKKAGLVSGGMVPGAGFDKTVWYTCDVCGCKVNSFEQLEIHQRSHTAKLKPEAVPNFGAAMSGLNPDRTMWYRCEVCMCNLNTESQLRIHQQSPAHLKKMGVAPSQQSTTFPLQQSTAFRLEHDTLTGPGFTNPATHNDSGQLTPLQSFLSEELFPAEFLSETDDTDVAATGAEPTQNQPFNLVVSDTTVPYHERYAAPDSNYDAFALQDQEPAGQGGSKRGQGSELAFATRSRGSADRATNHRDLSDPQSQSDIHGLGDRLDLGARPKDTWTGGQGMVNPYAATHNFYCHTCKRPMNTRESYENHMRGKHHLQKVSTEPAPRRRHMHAVPLPVGYVPTVGTTPRGYQRELYFKAIQGDALCFLPTGTGKTLVSVLTMAAMLEHEPSRSVLFLVDKVLLVLQQAQYIRQQLQHTTFNRYNPDSEDMDVVCRRPLQVAAVCMGQQNTGGVPLWKHDVIVVTAAFCQNLLDKEILRWEDFSLVVFDEAHHCEKAHPFNSLLKTFHNPAHTASHRPKILGLTASPAGKANVPQTVQMLESLVLNMGGVSMAVVEKPENVAQKKEYQSNAQMIIKTLSTEESSDSLETSSSVKTFKHELEVYILRCYLKLMEVSNVRNYVNVKGVGVGMSEADVRRLAGGFVETFFDLFQSSLSWLTSSTVEQPMEKVSFSLLTQHVAGVCRALSSLLEGGPLCMLEDMVELQTSQFGFNLARQLGLPCDTLFGLVSNHGNEEYGNHGNSGGGGRGEAFPGLSELLWVLTDGGAGQTGGEGQRSISLVLVKQRSTAHQLTKILMSSPELLRLGLQTATVVGHGGGGSTDRGMNVKQQKRVLEDIKQYKYQIIVATSVAEEGVDWPDCERVISLYPPSTVTALVQMRGRARRIHSQFVVLCASQAEEDKLRDIINREQNMIAATKILVDRSRKQQLQ